jgi:hypothetical protein
MIFEVLARAKSLIGLEQHKYLGLGSMWFADFRLAHRILEIDHMISLELPVSAPRAAFNKPYRGIQVESQSSHAYFGSRATEDWAAPFVCWLDYDGVLKEESVKDATTFLNNCACNSVLILTVNGVRNSYRSGKSGDPKKDRLETSIGAIEKLLGSVSIPNPHDFAKNAAGVYPDLSDVAFPAVLGDSLLEFMIHKVAASGRASGQEQLRFVPLFNFSHQDGARMVTVGGAICGPDSEDIWRNDVAKNVAVNGTSKIPTHLALDLIPITLKEKLTLDNCLPQVEPDFLAEASRMGVKLSDVELKKYFKHYKNFPVFLETPV